MKTFDFDSLKADWSRDVKSPVGNWTEEIRTLDRRWKRSRIAGTVSLGLTTAFFIAYLTLATPQTWYGWAGILIIMADMLLYLGLLWHRRNDSGFDMTLGVGQFAVQAEHTMRNRLWITQKILPWYMISLLVGINLTYLEVLARGSLPFRWTVHVGVTVVMIFAGRILYKRQCRKIEAKTKPVLAALKEIASEMNSRKT